MVGEGLMRSSESAMKAMGDSFAGDPRGIVANARRCKARTSEIAMTIAIAGGGIGGLAGAIALARAGRRAVVFEQADGFAEVGAGVQVGPNGVRALQALGAWEALRPAHRRPRRIVVRDALSGATLNEIARNRLRRTLRRALSRRPPGRSPGRPPRHGAGAAGDRAQDRRCGDGLRCPRWRGHRASRAGGDLRGRGAGRRRRAAFRRARPLLGASPPESAGVLYRALVPIEAVPGDTETDCVALWLYPGGHAVHYPVSGGASMNIVVAGEARGSRRLGRPGRARRRARLPARSRPGAHRSPPGAA
jgi:salicylate hydroxylase